MGYSLESLVAPFLGYEGVAPPGFLQAAYDEGNRLEPIVLDHLRGNGWKICGEQTEVEIEIVPGEVIIRGHIDAYEDMVTGGRAVLEVKTMAHSAWLDFEKNGWGSKSPLIEKYKWQQGCYVIATGVPHIMVAWDKSTEGRFHVEITRTPFYDLQTLANKVLAAEQAIRDGVLPEGCTDYPCPYFYLHENKAHVPVEQAGEELETLLSLWLDADKMEKAFKKQKDRYRELILAQSPDEALAGKIKGACGVTVSTNWVEEKHVEYDVKAHWETRIQGPKNVK